MYLGQVMKKILSHKVTAAHNVNVSKSCPSFLNGILQLLKGSDFEWAIPASFRSFLTILQKNYSLQSLRIIKVEGEQAVHLTTTISPIVKPIWLLSCIR